MTLSVLVLAGGRAERMGGRKADRAWRNGTLLSHAVDVAGTVSRDVIVAAGAARDGLEATIDASVRWIDDAPEARGEGPLGGVIAGLRAAAFPWVWLLACDMPYVDRAALEPLIAARDGRAPVVAYPGARGVETLGSLIERDLAGLASTYAEEGERSLRGLFARAEVQLVPDPPRTNADPGRTMLHNVNTLDELEAARRGDAHSRSNPRRTSSR